MHVQTYLLFKGRCEEALHFYRDAIGAELQAQMRYSDSPESPPPGCTPPRPDWIMHANFCVGDTQIMASDDPSPGAPSFAGFSLTLHCADAAEAAQRFAALSAQGEVTMPLGPTFFAPAFGMLKDRFGVPWMVIVATPAPGCEPAAPQ